MKNTGKGPVTLGHAEFVRGSTAALLVKIEGHSGTRWIPKSVIHDDSELWEADTSDGLLVVEEWFAEKEGYI